jgi:hypothetical protein
MPSIRSQEAAPVNLDKKTSFGFCSGAPRRCVTIIAMFIVLVIAAKVGFSPTDVAAKL